MKRLNWRGLLILLLGVVAPLAILVFDPEQQTQENISRAVVYYSFLVGFLVWAWCKR